MVHHLDIAKGLVQVSEAMRHAMQGHPRQTAHSQEFWQNLVHWRREWQTTPVFSPQELHERYEKTKNMTPEDEPPRSEGVWYAVGEEQRKSSRKNEEAKKMLSSGYVQGWK